MQGGRNIAIIGGHRRDFRLSVFNAALMKDPEGVLEKQGPNALYKDMFRFPENAHVADKQATIRSYLQEAMEYAGTGIISPGVATALDFPDELIEALDAESELAEAFHALTPGRQKS